MGQMCGNCPVPEGTPGGTGWSTPHNRREASSPGLSSTWLNFLKDLSVRRLSCQPFACIVFLFLPPTQQEKDSVTSARAAQRELRSRGAGYRRQIGDPDPPTVNLRPCFSGSAQANGRWRALGPLNVAFISHRKKSGQ